MKHLSVEDGTKMDEREAMALETLHNASQYLAAHFSIHMKRNEAKSNLEARAHLFNCSNLIFKQHGCGITREEVEGAREQKA